MTHSHHDHGHHHNHSHGVGTAGRLGVAALLTAVFMVVEVAGGLLSGSLALLADAGHMLTDFAALALAWFAVRLSRRPADEKRTYGFDRLSILIAYTNGMALFAIAAWIVVEAWHRFSEPAPVLGGLMFWVALGGLAVNLLSFWILHGGDRTNLNMRAAALHVMGDLLGSIAALIAAVVIIWTGWSPIDPILSVLVALIILRSAWQVVRDSGHILLEGAPHDIDTRDIATDLAKQFPEIAEVHHVHAWSISQERPMLTLHARLARPEPPEHIAIRIKQRLKERFGVAHATVEIEFDVCADAAQ